MLYFGCGAPRLIAGATSASAIAAALLFGAAGTALADPPEPAPAPPGCTAADLAGVSADVAAGTSAYLFSHPDVNDYFTGLRGQPRSEIREDLQNYMNANPQVHADLQSIRQPLTDLQNRCEWQPSGAPST
ncbi:heme-binding protein [uncultured Mycobacterium sp.]|uniref:heme-binding protein n=1 Tax=uncultured Mycobacterium sp. TaxID=171292 RepID=UPI0035CB37FB